MRFRVLGDLELLDGDRDVTPSAPKPREVLALLVLRHNRVVRITELIDELWGEQPPPSALPTLQTYIYKLRKVLSTPRAAAAGCHLRTTPHGYVLAVPSTAIDLCRFEQLAAEGAGLVESGDPARASVVLGQALALWRGAALTDVTVGGLLGGHVTKLEESRLRVLQQRVDADLALGRHHALVGELKAITAAHPLAEDFHRQLMLALHRCSRRFEALEVYQRLRRVMTRELSLTPSAPLRRLHEALLTADPALDADLALDAGPARAVPPRPEPAAVVPVPVPAQLPPDVDAFSGRRVELELLERALLGAEAGEGAVRVVSITGMPGVGKSALAIHAAHQVRDSFEGGHLRAGLGGSTPDPADPFDVLGDFLVACGVPPERMPATLDERSKLFRTWCARRPVLVLLDDAASPAQVEPLLPGSPHCSVIVTGRSHALSGATTVRLRPFDLEDGVELLRNLLGGARVATCPAARTIVRVCDGLPLALRAAGARLAAMPAWTLSDLAHRLGDTSTRLRELGLGEFDVRACYDATYRCLGEETRTAFRLLSLFQLAEFTAPHAARLLGCDIAAAETLLERLVEQHLLRVLWRGETGELRYAYHRLTGAYARELLQGVLLPDEPATTPPACLQTPPRATRAVAGGSADRGRRVWVAT